MNPLFKAALLASTLSTLVMCPPDACADAYNDCILESMKGVSSDLAARMVAQSCRAKADDLAKKTEKAKSEQVDKDFGTLMKESDYYLRKDTYGPSYRPGEFQSSVLIENPGDTNITFIVLTVLDGDFYDFKSRSTEKLKSSGTRSNDPTAALDGFLDSWGVNSEKVTWEKARTHHFVYQLVLPPGKSTRLLFKSTKQCYMSIAQAREKPTSWKDKVQWNTDVSYVFPSKVVDGESVSVGSQLHQMK
jgi:hypothetical protein